MNDEEKLEALPSRTDESKECNKNSPPQIKTSGMQSKTPPIQEQRERVLAAFKRVLKLKKQRLIKERLGKDAELQMTPVASEWIM